MKTLTIKLLAATALLLSTAACGTGPSQQAQFTSALYTADAGYTTGMSRSNEFFFNENN